MKYLLFLTCSLTFFSCGDRFHELPPIAEKPSIQIFNIQNGKDTAIVGKDGTIIKFSKNSLVTSNGSVAEGTLVVQLTEFYSKKDFIANRLSTNTTDRKILKSSGMVLINAFTEKGDTLKLREDRPMTLIFKRIDSSKTANLFLGEKGKNNEIRWRALPPVYKDTIALFKTTITQLSYGEEMVRVDAKVVIGNDTIEVTDDNRSKFEKVLNRFRPRSIFETTADSSTTDSDESRYLYNPGKSYLFETSKFGYLNCDIFIDRELYEFIVGTDKKKSDVFVVVDSLNSIFYPDSVSDAANEYIFYIPRNVSISVVAYNKTDDKHFFKIEKTKSDATKMNVVLTEATLENIKNEIHRVSENAR